MSDHFQIPKDGTTIRFLDSPYRPHTRFVPVGWKPKPPACMLCDAGVPFAKPQSLKEGKR